MKDKLTRLTFALSSALMLSPHSPAAHGASGAPLWTNFYNGAPYTINVPHAVTVDRQGNVFVTGEASEINGGYSEFATVKYSEAGVPLWTNRYAGGGDLSAQAMAMAVDSNGNVFVAGASYSNNGNLRDFATVAYSSSGTPLWTNSLPARANSFYNPRGIAVGAGGNVFVTGSSVDPANSSDYTTVAYSGAGAPLWTNRCNGPGNGADGAAAVAVDASGNVFVTGSSANLSGKYDYTTVAYSGAGVPIWTNSYNAGNADQFAAGMAVDANGNVFVTGTSASHFSSYAYSYPIYQYATVAYSDSGVPLWTNVWGDGINVASAMAVDSNGHVFVTGYEPGGGDYTTLAYSSAGVPLWTNSYRWGVGAPAIAVDTGGNVFIAGDAFDNGYQVYATIAYSGDGVPFWTNLVTGVHGLYPATQAIAVDSGGNVLVTGYSGDLYDSHYTTIKYSSSLPTAVIQASPRSRFPADTNLIVIAVDNASACVSLDGSSSSTPDNGLLTCQWFNDVDSVPFAAGAMATDCLGLGTHNIRLIVTDSRGAIGTATVMVEIISPCAAVDIAVDAIEHSDLARSRKAPLLVSLGAACQAFEGGQFKPGINELYAFEHKVGAQVQASHPALAQRLTVISEAIVDGLGKR